MILSTLIAATLMLADATAAPLAAAAPHAAPPAAGATPAKPPEDRLICSSEEVTGSLMPKKTCRRASDIARERQEQRENLQRIQREVGSVSH